MKNEIIIINGIRAYEGEDRVAYLGLEEVARGLGFTTVAKSGNEVVRWNRVEKYICDILQLEESPYLRTEFIPENVFYKLCMKANNDVARKFQSLVCDEILPSIRKNGMYANEMTLEKMIADPSFAIGLLTKLKEEQDERKRLEAKVVEQAPKVEYHDRVLQPDKLVTTTQVAKDLGMSATKLNRILNEKGVIFKKSNTWFFYDKYQHMIPEYADYVIGENFQQLKWTEKGRKWIIELLKETN